MSAPNPGGVSRRRLLSGMLGAAAGWPLLSACSGLNTSGGSDGDVNFLSTQFTPIEERQRFEKILAGTDAAPAAYNPVEGNVFTSTLRTQADAGSMQVSLAGGLHSDLAPIADLLIDLDDVLDDLSGSGIPAELTDLGRLGGSGAKYIPWIQASYVLAVHRSALEWLPSGADVTKLSYDDFLDWAAAAHRANGAPVFGFPAGPEGLAHRFFQGYLLPAFTGGQITTFRNADAVTAWQYMSDLWPHFVPASTNYDFMQEPLASGEVLVAWDHVARLVEAPKDHPDDWLMVPSPTGPKGLAYMLVVAGLSIPDGAPQPDAAKRLITALADPGVQVDVLRQNAFFPVVAAELPDDLGGGIGLEAAAIKEQQDSPDAIVALPPVGLGERDGEVSAIFSNCFRQICLDGSPIRSVLDEQAGQLQAILDELQVPCWAPDPVSGVCEVG